MEKIDFPKLNVILCLKALLKSNSKCSKCSSKVSDLACTSSTNVNKNMLIRNVANQPLPHRTRELMPLN